jgi:hypothetical protein
MIPWNLISVHFNVKPIIIIITIIVICIDYNSHPLSYLVLIYPFCAFIQFAALEEKKIFQFSVFSFSFFH